MRNDVRRNKDLVPYILLLLFFINATLKILRKAGKVAERFSAPATCGRLWGVLAFAKIKLAEISLLFGEDDHELMPAA